MKARLRWLVAIVGAGAVALSATAQGSPKLAVGPDAGGYLCPDGRQLYVKSCYDELPDAGCGVVNMHLPSHNGYQRVTTEIRANLASSVAGCKIYPLEFRDGVVSLVLPKSAAPAQTAQPPAATPAPKIAPGAASPGPGTVDKITVIDGMAIGYKGVRSSLVRISPPGSAPPLLYVDEASRKPTGRSDIVTIWALQVWPDGMPSFAYISAAWVGWNVNCKDYSYEAPVGIKLDRQANVLGTLAVNSSGTSTKDPTKETPHSIACETTPPSKGPRFANANDAIADAIAGAAPKTAANSATSAAKPAQAPAVKPAAPAPKPGGGAAADPTKLVRLSPKRVQPYTHYVLLDSTTPSTTVANALDILALQIRSDEEKERAGARGVWSGYAVTCNQLSIRLTMEMAVDDRGASGNVQLFDMRLPLVKGGEVEHIAKIACGLAPPTGPRLASVALAIADAAKQPTATPRGSTKLAVPVKAPIRLPESEAEKTFLQAIKTNRMQAAVNATIVPPGGTPVRISELTDEQGMTALHWATANRSLSALRWLLDKRPVLNLADNRGRTPLRIALDNKHADAMKMLLDSGADPNLVWPYHPDDLKGFRTTRELVDFMIAAGVPASK